MDRRGVGQNSGTSGMKKFKGTKGDWKIFDFNGCGPCIDISINALRNPIAQVYSPTEVEHDKKQTKEHKANAQLIATAPKMLEVLEETLKAFDVWENLEFNDELYLKIEKTIKKATKI